MPPKRPPPAEVLGRPQGRFPPPREVLDRPSRPWPTAPPPRTQTIRDVFEELNYPGAAKLKTALKERGIAFKAAEVDALVKKTEARQLQAKPTFKYDGKITAGHVNQRWAADTINYTATPSGKESDPFRYILVAQDIFSRKVYAEALKKNDPPNSLDAFKRFVQAHGKPEELNTDEGSEFSTVFAAYLKEQNITHRRKHPLDVNDIATIDRAIAEVKKALERTGSMDTWHERVDKVVAGINKTPHGHLLEAKPNAVQGNDQLQFALQKEAARDLQTNKEVMEKRGETLKREGAYKEITKQTFVKGRGFKPQVGREIHKVARVERNIVEDTKGERIPTKRVQPIPHSRGS